MTHTELDVYLCETNEIDVATSELVSLLSDEEREHHDRLAFAADRRDYAAAHAQLRLALAARMSSTPEQLQLSATHWGRPFLVASHEFEVMPSFSLAHSRGLVACAIADGPVGIDVELIDRSADVLRLADDVFSREEAAALRECAEAERAARFSELWTLKESLAKARGLGLGLSMRHPSFRVAHDGVHVEGAFGWTFHVEDVDGRYKLAVATRGQAAIRLEIVDASALARGRLVSRGAVRIQRIDSSESSPVSPTTASL